MIDGITSLDASASADALLTNDRLRFRGMADSKTGFVISKIQWASDRGLTFRLVPRKSGNGYRVEVKGSLHKYHNNGQHNADQFTANALLLTLDQLVRWYGFDLFSSRINNVEFGVNLELPFPVSHVLKNLLCYKNQPFALDTQSDTPYYVCDRQQYAVKLYDKGKQKGLTGNLLRVEIRVKKMEYFKGTGVQLATLADLMNVANYEPLGALLVDTFTEILFDDPTINPADLSPRERKMYRDGRNPRFWQQPDNLTAQQANTHNQRLSRAKQRYRAVLNQHGSNRQREISALIGQTWNQLTAVDNDLLKRIHECRMAWQNLAKSDSDPYLLESTINPVTTQSPAGNCHELTDFTRPVNEFSPGATCHELTDLPNADLSRINPLYSGVICDIGKPGYPAPKPADQSPKPGAIVCPVTGATIDRPQPGQRFMSAVMLRNNDDLLLTLDSQHRQYAKGSKEDLYNQAAHNVRNKDSNPRNNLRRKIIRLNEKKGSQQSLFPDSDIFRLNDQQRALLDYWKGTPYEVQFT